MVDLGDLSYGVICLKNKINNYYNERSEKIVTKFKYKKLRETIYIYKRREDACV